MLEPPYKINNDNDIISSHNDVHEGNCLIDPNQMVDGKSKMEALRLIDFEYSNYGYRLVFERF